MRIVTSVLWESVCRSHQNISSYFLIKWKEERSSFHFHLSLSLSISSWPLTNWEKEIQTQVDTIKAGAKHNSITLIFWAFTFWIDALMGLSVSDCVYFHIHTLYFFVISSDALKWVQHADTGVNSLESTWEHSGWRLWCFCPNTAEHTHTHTPHG